MTMPTTPFFPAHLQPMFGATESPSLPGISTELTNQRIQRRSRGTTHKRVWKMNFQHTEETLLDLQKHWESVDGDGFPFVSPIGRYWQDIPTIPDSNTGGGYDDFFHTGMIGASAAVDFDTATDYCTESGLYSAVAASVETTVGHNLLPAGVANCSDDSLMGLIGCTLASSTAAPSLSRSRMGNSSFFVTTSGGASDFIQPLFANRAPVNDGPVYTGSIYLTGTGTVGIKLAYYTAVGALIGSPSTASTAVLDATWQRVSVSMLAPATSAFASLWIGTFSAQSVSFWADGAQIELGGDLRGWAYPGYGYTALQVGGAPTLWQSAYGGRIHVVKYVGNSMPIARKGWDITTIPVQLEEDLGGY